MADSLLSIGLSAIVASQYAIQAVSSNIANADTEGYRLRTVNLSETETLTTGVVADEVLRSFNTYLEELYLARYTGAERYETQSQWLASVESILEQDEDSSLSSLLEAYFQAWSDVAADPDDEAVATVLVETAQTLASLLQDVAGDLDMQAALINQELAGQVDEVNELTAALAELNAGIVASNENSSLLDERDSLIRELASYLDVDVQYQSDGRVRLATSSGLTLVDGDKNYELKVEAAKAWASLTSESTFEGRICFSGQSGNEYTLEVVDAGAADGTARFRVSYDGGQTWLADDDGNDLLFAADARSKAVDIDGVTVWFGAGDDASAASSGSLAAGDTFTIVPKTGIYWYKTTSSFVNVTSLEGADGNDVSGRLSGGSLAGLCTVRDACIGSYADDLDALARALIWETNYAYSQGASSEPMTSVYGACQADDAGAALSGSGLVFASEVQAGSFSLALYDQDTGQSLGVYAVDFGTTASGASSLFDPAVHSLQDVAQAINDTLGGQVLAAVVDGRLQLTAADNVAFCFAGDSTGLLAACGLNVFFTGDSAETMAVNAGLLDDPTLLAAGAVDASGLVETGDNATALAVSELVDKTVSIALSGGRTTQATMQDFLADLVSRVGTDTAQADSLAAYWEILAQDLDDEQESASGVSLDEELVKLEKYQRMYEAASKIIEISQEMFATLIDIV